MIQDIAPLHLFNEWKKDARPKAGSAVMHFSGHDILCTIDDNQLKFPQRRQFPEGDEAFTYLFSLDGREYYLLAGDSRRELPGFSYRDIVLFRTEKPKELAFAAVSAWHLYCWYRDSQYCGRCGTRAVHDPNERMMHCPKCGNMIFPRVMPSVIVAVTNGDKVVLTQYNRPGAQRTALVAGFVEFGETVEQTVHREVREELGLEVTDLHYYKSQPWGISGGGVMMGYWCRVDGDDTITLDRFELADAAWVSRAELQETYTDAGIALTGEMIRVFSEGKDPYSQQ